MAEMKTSNSSWKKPLAEILNQLARNNKKRIAILGIGSELNGDDAAGVWVARKLESQISANPDLLILDCGSVPENAVRQLRVFSPNLILMIDAAELASPAGIVVWIDPLLTTGYSASSHTLPLAVITKYLQNEFSCPIGLLGIQPLSMEFGESLSSSVKNSVTLLVKELLVLLVS
jgi:hydrogenase 3 maturation protease